MREPRRSGNGVIVGEDLCAEGRCAGDGSGVNSASISTCSTETFLGEREIRSVTGSAIDLLGGCVLCVKCADPGVLPGHTCICATARLQVVVICTQVSHSLHSAIRRASKSALD
jgi:hypothetical protein